MNPVKKMAIPTKLSIEELHLLNRLFTKASMMQKIAIQNKINLYMKRQDNDEIHKESSR